MRQEVKDFVKAKNREGVFLYHTKINLQDTNNPHTKIINLIEKNKSVLEFGCSTGYMSRVLKQNGCRIIGIEIDQKAAKIAGKYCNKIIVGDIEKINYDKNLGNASFDKIIFADTLEHLKHPEKALVKIRKFLKEDGKLIISVPNVAHASVRLELLTGEFEYEKTGILDESHLRFFTKKSIVRLLDSCGYYIEHIDTVSKGLTKKTIQKFLSKINIYASDKLIKLFNHPESLAYQYIVVASIKKPINYSAIGITSMPIKAINDSERKIIEVQENMQRIFNSRGWKILSFIHNIRIKIPFLKSL